MNSMPIRVALRQIGLWIVLVTVVVLLTLLFSFLGTITCAVLTGMMTGAARRWRWQDVVVSLVFPAIVFTHLQLSKGELQIAQQILLALLCLAAFWLTYLVTALLMFVERRAEPAAQENSPSPQATETSAAALANGNVVVELGMQELQGTWSCEIIDRAGHVHFKVIEITDNRFALRITNSDGARLALKGAVKVKKFGRAKAVVFCAEREEAQTSKLKAWGKIKI